MLIGSKVPFPSSAFASDLISESSFCRHRRRRHNGKLRSLADTQLVRESSLACIFLLDLCRLYLGRAAAVTDSGAAPRKLDPNAARIKFMSCVRVCNIHLLGRFQRERRRRPLPAACLHECDTSPTKLSHLHTGRAKLIFLPSPLARFLALLPFASAIVVRVSSSLSLSSVAALHYAH